MIEYRPDVCENECGIQYGPVKQFSMFAIRRLRLEKLRLCIWEVLIQRNAWDGRSPPRLAVIGREGLKLD